MSLIHWWPLNGDTQDKITGKSGTLKNGGMVSGAGKLGQCYSSNNNHNFTSATWACADGVEVLNSSLVGEVGDEYSFACWFKVHGKHGQYQSCIMSSGDWNKGNCWVIGFNQTNNAIFCPVNNYNKGRINLSSTLVKDQWYHLATVYKNGVSAAYLNGTKVGEVSAQGIYQSSSTTAYIGRDQAHNGFFPYNGDINDLRIYDHALSVEEIRELSKGLMIHYSFNDNLVENAENLITGLKAGGRTTYNSSEKAIYTQGLNGDTYFYLQLSSAMVPGKQYTVACIGENIGEDKLFTFGMQGQSSSHTRFTIKDGYNSFTFTATAYVGGVTSLLMDDTARTGWANIAKFYNFQLFEGDHVPVLNGQLDWLTNEAGYEEPMSVKNLVLSSDTNCGTYCGIFDSTKPTQIRMNPRLEGATDVTLACWLYPQSGSTAFTDNALYSVIAGTGINLYAYGRSNAWLSCANCLTLNAWNHVVTTYSATERILYVNGKKIGSDTVSGVFDARTSLDVGYGSTTTRALNGRISDFRVYSTTLSEDDVKILYESRASIDKEQDVFSHEFIEVFNENMVTTDSWEQDGIYDDGGLNAVNMMNRLRTKYIPILGGLSYTYKAATDIDIRCIHYYDVDNKWITVHSVQANSATRTAPENAAYVRWVLQRTNANLEIPVANIADYGAVMMPTLVYEDVDIVDSAETVVNKTYNINTNDICENHRAGLYKKGTMTGRNFNEV